MFAADGRPTLLGVHYNDRLSKTDAPGRALETPDAGKLVTNPTTSTQKKSELVNVEPHRIASHRITHLGGPGRCDDMTCIACPSAASRCNRSGTRGQDGRLAFRLRYHHHINYHPLSLRRPPPPFRLLEPRRKKESQRVISPWHMLPRLRPRPESKGNDNNTPSTLRLLVDPLAQPPRDTLVVWLAQETPDKVIAIGLHCDMSVERHLLHHALHIHPAKDGGGGKLVHNPSRHSPLSPLTAILPTLVVGSVVMGQLAWLVEKD
ncbi:hypothetical protein SODALDRAFT_381607 [Sodiomyces alkalinus F11]|uniref:Uncharacterized protein n=1 Tax=Sodiomyces alkalinus (strain CBS 110278 / VKM F-3762 / F11) TaxID=1314773 RepID=A0A3N2PLN9_SODAK|nr:hypothetical protein SODALDRAFT_381607 [Sodiomyces alkalinus F11]ROT35451.1 hypothetical protein SODALDRAFT_381607 [Sodiomyces alkalinus F11]